MADVEKIIKDLQGNLAGSNDDQMKAVQLLKGLATSDEPISNEFMKKLDKETTRISKEVLKKEESIKEGNRWEYLDARGVECTGELVDIVDLGHNDISYYFKNDKTGSTDIVSGSRLKKMKKIYERSIENTIEVQEDVAITQEDGTKIILEKGDKIRVLNENPEEDMVRAKSLLQHYIDKYNDDPIKVRQTILDNLVNSRYNRPSNDFIQIIWDLYNQHYPS